MHSKISRFERVTQPFLVFVLGRRWCIRRKRWLPPRSWKMLRSWRSRSPKWTTCSAATSATVASSCTTTSSSTWKRTLALWKNLTCATTAAKPTRGRAPWSSTSARFTLMQKNCPATRNRRRKCMYVNIVKSTLTTSATSRSTCGSTLVSKKDKAGHVQFVVCTLHSFVHSEKCIVPLFLCILHWKKCLALYVCL